MEDSMHFSVTRDHIFRALQKVINVVPSKTTIEILYNILLTTEDGKLKLTASDLEITQIAWCECDVKESGSITLPGRLLMDILREMPDNTLTFKVESNFKVQLKSQFGEYKLSGQDKNDYPGIPSLETEQSITLKNEYLRRMIEKTIFACSSDNLRPALTGVFCQILKEEIRMVATDGHRLVKIVNRDFISNDVERELVLPTRALNFVARNLPDDGTQEIILGAKHILFKFAETLIYSRIITEPYPDYERVIPEFNSKELVINRESFTASVKRVSLFSNPISYQVKLNLVDNKLNIYAQDIDYGGEAHEAIECKYDSPELTIAYNANYLMDILRHMDTDDVRMALETPDGPGLIFPNKQEENEDLLMLIMPVRLNN
jgi:DNA polymerase-3 subunit beta